MKYALIGCGRIAVNHIKAALNNKLEIIAVCDVLPEAMETLLAKHGLEKDVSIQRYTDYKTMLAEHPDLQLVSIATESGIHAQIALDCIDAGVNVIIEKPMAMSRKAQSCRVSSAIWPTRPKACIGKPPPRIMPISTRLAPKTEKPRYFMAARLASSPPLYKTRGNDSRLISSKNM